MLFNCVEPDAFGAVENHMEGHGRRRQGGRARSGRAIEKGTDGWNGLGM